MRMHNQVQRMEFRPGTAWSQADSDYKVRVCAIKCSKERAQRTAKGPLRFGTQKPIQQAETIREYQGGGS